MTRKLGLTAALGLGLFACSSEPLQAPPGSEGGSGPSPSEWGDSYALVDYPPGPYGNRVGSVMPNLSFLGWRDPVSAAYDPQNFETVRLSDFYNPNGSRNDTKLLMLNASGVWCAVCRAEMRQMHEDDIYRTYRSKGVEIIGVLFEDAEFGPAKPEDLEMWGSFEGHAIEFPLVLDPGFKVGTFFTSDATPLNLLVDPTTMRILDATMGYDSTGGYWQHVDAVLAE